MLSFKLTDEAELRLLMPHHAAEYAALVRQEHENLKKWIVWSSPDFSEEDALHSIKRYLQKLADNDGMLLGIFYEDRFAGWASYLHWDWKWGPAVLGHTELGYWLGSEFQGKGLVTKTVSAMTDYALIDLGLNRVEMRMDIRNERSSAVPKRLGYKFSTTLPQYIQVEGEWVDMDVYYILADHWKEIRNGR